MAADARRLERVLAELPEDPALAARIAESLGVEAVAGEAKSAGFYELLSHHLPNQFPARRAEERAARFRARQIERATTELSKFLADAGIQSLALKGAPLAARLYPEPWLRPSVDVDLLVRPSDLERARDLLLASGWQYAMPPPQSALDFGHDLSFVDARRTLLELHHRPTWHFQARFDLELLFARSVPRSLGTGTVRTLSPEDDLVHLCAHAGAHAFEGAKWLFDLKLAASQRDLSWDRAISGARAARVAAVTGAALEEASRRVRAPVPASVLRSLAPGLARQAALRLCQRIPAELARTRSFAFDVLLADGVSKEWLLRFAAPPIKRASRAARLLSRIVWRA